MGEDFDPIDLDDDPATWWTSDGQYVPPARLTAKRPDKKALPVTQSPENKRD